MAAPPTHITSLIEQAAIEQAARANENRENLEVGADESNTNLRFDPKFLAGIHYAVPKAKALELGLELNESNKSADARYMVDTIPIYGNLHDFTSPARIPSRYKAEDNTLAFVDGLETTFSLMPGGFKGIARSLATNKALHSDEIVGPLADVIDAKFEDDAFLLALQVEDVPEAEKDEAKDALKFRATIKAILEFCNAGGDNADISWMGMPLHEYQFIRIIQHKVSEVSDFPLPKPTREYTLIWDIDSTGLEMINTRRLLADPAMKSSFTKADIMQILHKAYKVQFDAEMLMEMTWQEWLRVARRPNFALMVKGLKDAMQFLPEPEAAPQPAAPQDRIITLDTSDEQPKITPEEQRILDHHLDTDSTREIPLEQVGILIKAVGSQLQYMAVGGHDIKQVRMSDRLGPYIHRTVKAFCPPHGLVHVPEVAILKLLTLKFDIYDNLRLELFGLLLYRDNSSVTSGTYRVTGPAKPLNVFKPQRHIWEL